MGCVRIERQGEGYEVHVTDPEIEAANRADTKGGAWKDPMAEYTFETWNQVKAFLDKVIDKAIPPDEYSRAFEKAAKEATSGK